MLAPVRQYAPEYPSAAIYTLAIATLQFQAL
jgi:hypothetical protein